ncbi:MAG: Crp/Fnr family transcriptional regulator [Sterolibacterium sp.]|jgi:CRP-like cAMP-binding protein|nr:Crp/Fnr family transcriptional regulator [Sterolibacterium sp.]
MAMVPDYLKDLELLRDLPPPQAERLSGLMTERSFARREIVFSKGDVGQFLCFLVEGRLQGVDFTLDGREVGLYFVEPGSYFGEMSVIDGQPRSDFVIAVARARVALLPADVARNLITQLPGIAEKVLLRLAQRLRSVSAQRALLGLPNPAQRVCAQLVQLVEQQGKGQASIPNAPTHQELAIMINASRETVTRVFQVLQARGVVARDGGSLNVIDPRYLRAVAEGQVEPPKAG